MQSQITAWVIGGLLAIIAWLVRGDIPPPVVLWLRQTNLWFPFGLVFAASLAATAMLLGIVRRWEEANYPAYVNPTRFQRFRRAIWPLVKIIRGIAIPLMVFWGFWNLDFYVRSPLIWLESVALWASWVVLIPELWNWTWYFALHRLPTLPRRVINMRFKLLAKLRRRPRPTASADSLQALPAESANPATSEHPSSLPVLASEAVPTETLVALYQALDSDLRSRMESFLTHEDAILPWQEAPQFSDEMQAELEEMQLGNITKAERSDIRQILGIDLPKKNYNRISLVQHRRAALGRLMDVRSDAWTIARDAANVIAAATSDTRSNFSGDEVQRYQDRLVSVKKLETEQKEQERTALALSWNAVLRAREFWRAVKIVKLRLRVTPEYKDGRQLKRDAFLFRLAICRDPSEALLLISKEIPPIFEGIITQRPPLPDKSAAKAGRKESAEEAGRPNLHVELGGADEAASA